MVKYKNPVLIALTATFLLFSFYPTIYEISHSKSLYSKDRRFILEHNYYWPDFNLYLSKVRQGYEERWLAVEKYTSEPHTGSLIQIFYLYLGKIGSILNISPNYAYQLGRIILSPLLLLIILLLVTHYFRSPLWQILAFTITLVSGSFPRLYYTSGQLQIGRYMEWWSNIDSLQRISFIPHILFGQVISFYLLYKLTILKRAPLAELQGVPLTKYKFVLYVLLTNAIGLVFPPSLITLIGVLFFLNLIEFVKTKKFLLNNSLYIILFSFPSLFYLAVATKTVPWSALVEFHRDHPMMVPLDQYLLGTGPIIIPGFLGSVLAIIKRRKQFYPLILWTTTTFLFASLFSVVKEQSPLRFTQKGLFIPLGILGTYFIYQLFRPASLKYLGYLLIILYLLENLFIMKTSLIWQLSFISQRLGANIPPVPYPPQTLYPLTAWSDAIDWLNNNTRKEDVVLAEITAGNFIPAYSGNFVYFGQSNTVDYNRKLAEVDSFFRGQMTPSRAEIFLKQGRIKYIFVGPQENEKLGGKKLEEIYSFVKLIYSNKEVGIYRF